MAPTIVLGVAYALLYRSRILRKSELQMAIAVRPPLILALQTVSAILAPR